jgi:hypothetical protein
MAALVPVTPALAFDVVGGDIDVIKVHVGASGLDEFGNAVCGPGDLNGDGIPDYVIAAHKTGYPLGDEGMVTAYSGADHSTLWIVEGENNDDRFGHALAAVADIDGDGVGELAVSAIYFDNGAHTNAGKVYLLSGADGSELWGYASIYSNHSFGDALAAAGDINGDGFEDVVVGMPGADSGALTNAGRIVVLNGRFGTYMKEVYGTATGNNFGTSVAGPGDLNADGYDDVVVGVPGYDAPGLVNAGRLTLVSGKWLAGLGGGQYLQILNGNAAGGELGYDVSRVGDVNDDGVGDFLAAAPFATTAYGTEAGVVYVYSGATRSKLEQLYGQDDYDHFGETVAAAGDVDHDGVPDALVGAPSDGFSTISQEGWIFAFSGRTGDLILEYEGDFWGGRLGSSLDTVGDLNGDGTAEIIAGAPFSDDHATDDGRATILSLEPYLSLSKLTTTGLGDSVDVMVDFGPFHGGEEFQILLSLSGDGPSVFDAGGVEVPLTADAWTASTFADHYPRWAKSSHGTLDGYGEKKVTFSNPALPLGSHTLYLAAVRYSGGVIAESSIVQVLEFGP